MAHVLLQQKIKLLGTGFCYRYLTATKPVSEFNGLLWFVFKTETQCIADVKLKSILCSDAMGLVTQQPSHFPWGSSKTEQMT